ncbi:hypothetical protein AYL99_11725 [Fonsecaea erecta]|uniref:Uncharacterized protein n=1 Tax=Fonsecaea erecta TaxID=1367422 RepID=A0A178Z343_9EURO|nr:hypothetical protein AYL99_11725 [Fonsecaea erecta]OAP54190.1 hypothetical protein AYL99_11725 [Fonsecaea erecta]
MLLRRQRRDGESVVAADENHGAIADGSEIESTLSHSTTLSRVETQGLTLTLDHTAGGGVSTGMFVVIVLGVASGIGGLIGTRCTSGAANAQKPSSLEQVYDWVVSESSLAALHGMSVMEDISMTSQGAPSAFKPKSLTAEEYLILWLGLKHALVLGASASWQDAREIEDDDSYIPLKGMKHTMDGKDSMLATFGTLTQSRETINLFMKVVLHNQPWRYDPSLMVKKWTPEQPTPPLKVAIEWSNRAVKPHYPMIRALKMVAEACKAVAGLASAAVILRTNVASW